MSRYRLHEASRIVHDTLTGCDDAHSAGNKNLTFRDFCGALELGASPCRHCFRDDAHVSHAPASGLQAEEHVTEEAGPDEPGEPEEEMALDKPRRGRRT